MEHAFKRSKKISFTILIVVVLVYQLLLFPQGVALAAMPFTHIFLAKKWAAHHQEAAMPQFMVGTLFPDIRYLGTVSRNATHLPEVSVDGIFMEKSLFKAGMMLHAWVDVIREEFAVASGIYDYLAHIETQYNYTLLKCLEDEILWNDALAAEAVEQLRSPNSLAWIEFKIDAQTVSTWHHHLASYLSQRPSRTLLALANANKPLFSIPTDKVKAWAAAFPDLAANPSVQIYVAALVTHFEKTMRSQASLLK